ncbi:MAG: orotidine-5'-phosphate decarboxylase [Mycoplasmataceae bacterium]|jgi:orotidine-5'-phosphate decarboxylase|nr:orotidine-5'-phosphate decarboxylase [Mycoplasmataceae bacterium]
MAKDVIIACDFSKKEELCKFLDQFKNENPFLKIGYQLFYATGVELINKLIDKGFHIFLDLKLHDIPNTVEQGVKSLVALNVDFITVHAAGGNTMMRAAVKAAKGSLTKILAVTQLTSTNQSMLEKELMIEHKMNDVVNHYAVNALEAGVYGVVCSALESEFIKKKISNNLITVTPGIRLSSEHDDQARVVTPLQARNNLADYIVVGRAITKDKDPLKAYQRIKKEFLGK